jgi:hypothetical protein
MGLVKSLVGQRFGRLEVKQYAGLDKRGKSKWLCVCACGGKIERLASHLMRGKIKSCGCLVRGADAPPGRTLTGAVATRNGMSKSPLYRVWNAMLQRCFNDRCKRFPDYGGRGITVCDRWLVFENFEADMSPRPPGLSIERKDNDRGYEPGNCVWATNYEQQNNRRNNWIVEVDGERMSLPDAARSFGIGQELLRSRLRSGVPVEIALMTPKRGGGLQAPVPRFVSLFDDEPHPQQAAATLHGPRYTSLFDDVPRLP